ncbi:MAG: hypothetical protein RIE58_01395 [Vicingaceae bacterium]
MEIEAGFFTGALGKQVGMLLVYGLMSFGGNGMWYTPKSPSVFARIKLEMDAGFFLPAHWAFLPSHHLITSSFHQLIQHPSYLIHHTSNLIHHTCLPAGRHHTSYIIRHTSCTPTIYHILATQFISWAIFVA